MGFIFLIPVMLDFLTKSLFICCQDQLFLFVFFSYIKLKEIYKLLS